MPQPSIYLLFICSTFGVIPFAGCSRTPQQPSQSDSTTSPQGVTTRSLGISSDLLCGPEATLPLLMATEVRQELKLTSEQNQKLELLKHELQGGKVFLDAAQGQQARQRIQSVITPNQLERLNQICLQLESANLLVHPKVQAMLEFTEEQKKELIHVLEEESARATELFAKTSPQDVRKMKQSLLKEIRIKKLAVLTPIQQEKYTMMQGDKIDLDTAKIYEHGK